MKRLGKRQQKRLLKLFLSLLVLLVGWMATEGPLATPDTIPSPGTYAVTKVHDGDTISVDMNGAEERIRFIGVDTPETQDPRKPVQCFGEAASQYTKELLTGKRVRLESDPLSSNRDRYDRLLRYVYLQDGRLAQAEIIKNGYGFAYTSFPFTKLEEFKMLEREARENERGLWQACEPTLDKNGYIQSNYAE